MKEKKKILVIADSPLVPSGVGTQTKYMIEALLKTGEYKFFCLAGAVKHKDYRLQKVQPWNEDWLIQPVNGYGSQNIVRATLRDYKPDALWFMTDPRYFVWLWEMENEIRPKLPMVYYHVWDNYPPPMYNKPFYESNDLVCTISKVTDDIVRQVSPSVPVKRIPHTVNTDIFKNLRNHKQCKEFRQSITGSQDKMIFFWNNRNARRKQSGTLIYWFKKFLDNVGHDKACLVMHTLPTDMNGQDLNAIVENLNLNDKKYNQVLFSVDKLSPERLAMLYSAVDCTINISDAEGFGLATLESLSCETPIIVNMTGGLQEQVTDGDKWFGFGIEPSSKAIIGSQDVPYIYEDRINEDDFVQSLLDFYNMSKEERAELGKLGRAHVLKEYGFDKYEKNWKETMDELIENHGSWETKKKHQSWFFGEIL